MPAPTEAGPTVRTLPERLGPQPAKTESSAPAALLGPSHPLTRALEDRRRETERVMATVAVLVGTAVAALTASAAPALSLAAAMALLVFAVRLAFVCDRVRREALQAVIDGHDSLPLECLREQRRRLADAPYQEHLAAWAEGLTQVHADALAPPLWSVPVLRAAEPELRELARLLRSGDAGVRGVAMLEQLLSCGATPYGNDQRALIEQLGRIRYHLIARA